MNAEDFEELKAICEEKGFDITIESMNEAMISVKKKDPWAGVEFVIPNHNSPCLKKPYKAVSFKNGFVQVYCPYSGDGSLSQLQLNEVDPSTEQAYVEQLEEEAFDRFGQDIDTSKIDDSNMNGGRIVFDKNKDSPFLYRKNTDTLYACGVPLYQAGKWAERVKERIEVKLIGYPTWTNNKSAGYDFCFHFKTVNGGENLETHKAGQFLASMLETYLNGELK